MGCAPSNHHNAADNGDEVVETQPGEWDDTDERSTAPHEQDPAPLARNGSSRAGAGGGSEARRRRKSVARRAVEIGDYTVVIGKSAPKPNPKSGETFIARANEGTVTIADEEVRVMVKCIEVSNHIVEMAAEASYTTPQNIINTLKDYQLQMQAVQHANLSDVITCDIRMQTLRVTSGFVEGSDISDMVGLCSIEDLRTLLRDMLNALTRLHSHSLAHGNVKVENVICDAHTDQYVLLDGGYGALTFFVDRTKLFDESNIKFQGYYPPESVGGLHRYDSGRGSSKVDISTEAQLLRHQKRDSWAVGVLTYMLVFGQQPFQEGSAAETFHRICEMDPIIPPHFTRSGLQMTNNLRDFINQLLNKDPDHRASLLQMLRHPFLRKVTDQKGLGQSLVGSENNLHNVDSTVFSTNLTRGPLEHSPDNGTLQMMEEVQIVKETFPCAACAGPIAPLAFQCVKCPNFVVCATCYRTERYQHDPAHGVFSSVVVEEMSDTKMSISLAGLSVNNRSMGQDSLSASCSPMMNALDVTKLMADDDEETEEGSDGEPEGEDTGSLLSGGASPGKKSQLVLINTNSLSKHEQTVFSMTGQLPEARLEVAKKASILMRKNSSSVMSNGGGCGTKEADDDGSESPHSNNGMGGGGGWGKGGAAKTLIGMAPPEDEYTVEEIVQECIDGSTAMLLNGMHISDVPAIVYDPPLEHIVELDLSSNSIKVLPADIANLHGLRKLLLGNNQLTELPDSIGDLGELEMLEVHHNKLTDLPQTLMFADSLKHLAMDYNECPAFPPVILDMPSLEVVYLASNTLIKAWPSVDDLKALGTITIGIDNEPHLFSRMQSMQRNLPGLKVLWNKIYPDMIIQGMYCGSLRSAQTPLVYEALKIKHILSMGRGLEPVVLPGMEQIGLNVDDIENADIEQTFDQAVAFIDNALSRGEGCLVHCFAGMSRSSTACIAYLMIKRGMRLDEAYVTTKRGRPAIYPNQGFFRQLLKLDGKLFPDSRPLDMDSMERDQVPMG